MGDKEEPVAVPAPDDRIVSLAELRRGFELLDDPSVTATFV
jgi:hypothetical protein